MSLPGALLAAPSGDAISPQKPQANAEMRSLQWPVLKAPGINDC